MRFGGLVFWSEVDVAQWAEKPSTGTTTPLSSGNRFVVSAGTGKACPLIIMEALIEGFGPVFVVVTIPFICIMVT